jgi:hypothetical protein
MSWSCHLATRPQTSHVSVAVQYPVTEIRQLLGIAAGMVRVRRIFYSQKFAIERR